MEYDVKIRNVFATQDIIDQLAGRGSMFIFRHDEWVDSRFYVRGNFDPHYSDDVQTYMRHFTYAPVHSTQDYTLYYVSAKGSLTKDYYNFPDGRTLIYERQTKFAYWQTQLASTDPLEVTVQELKFICPPANVTDLRKHVTYLNATMRKYQINTRLRQVHFLSQLAHESAHFGKTLEGASGRAYEGNKVLGNTELGDGPRFKGRGLIQLTGRDAYTHYGRYIGRNLTEGNNMSLVEKEPYASDCGGWFWLIYKKAWNLNAKADRDDFVGVTKGVNGGINGIEERRVFYKNAKRAFGLSSNVTT